MNLLVIIQPEALADIENAYRFIAEDSPQSAAKWFNGMVGAI